MLHVKSIEMLSLDLNGLGILIGILLTEHIIADEKDYDTSEK